MANQGQYIDRNPTIVAAGISNKPSDGARTALEEYTLEEGAGTFVKPKCLELLRKKPRYELPCYFRPLDNITPVFTPELEKSRFLAFREKLAETMYCNRAPLGKARNPIAIPESVTNTSRTFGSRHHTSEPAYGVIFPKKTVDQVNREYYCWHEKYKLSHNHYFPSEQINRNYDRKSFDPTCTFGYSSNADLSGAGVRRAMNNCNRLMVIGKTQKFFLEKSLGGAGKKILRHELNVPENMTFGKPSSVVPCTIEALLTNIDPCRDNNDLVRAISHLNRMRRYIANSVHFQVHDLKSALIKFDINKTGCLPFRKIMDVAHGMHIHIDEEKMHKALQHFGLLGKDSSGNDRCSIDIFCELLSIRFPLPDIGSISPMPKVMDNKDTTYRLMCKDLEKQAWRNDISKLEIEHPKRDADPTTVKDLVTPGIDVRIGLEDKDYLVPRTKEQIRRVFKHLEDSEFEEVWRICMEKMEHATDLVCVRLFLDESNKYTADYQGF